MRTKQKNGYALVVVMFAIAAIAGFISMLSFSAAQQSFTTRRLADNIKAKAIAESGCEYAYAILSNDWDARNDDAQFAGTDEVSESYMGKAVNLLEEDYDPKSVGDGAYKISVEPIGPSAALVTTHGTFGNSKAEAIIGVQDLGGSSDDDTVLDGLAFSYAILCGGEMDFSGCGAIASPDGAPALFHANGEMSLRGTADALINISSSSKIRISNNVTVDGNITAPALQYNPVKVTMNGTATETAVPTIEIPDIDLTPYFNWAKKNGEVKSGGFTTSIDYTPNGGILWVDGDFLADNNAAVNGTVIATGSIHMSGESSVNPTLCAFGLVARDGDITITSSGTLTGLIYAKTGSFSHTANGLIKGQLIVNGDIRKAGNSDILTAFTPNIPAPPDRNVSTLFIGISAWQK